MGRTRLGGIHGQFTARGRSHAFLPGDCVTRIAGTKWMLPAIASAILLAPQAVAAQDAVPGSAEEAAQAGRDYWSVLADPEEDACDAPTDPEIIVVCAEKSDPEKYMIEIEPGDDGKTGSGVPRAPDVFGIPPCESYQFCGKFGKVPPPAYMVDFDALPETPADSAAARLYGGPTTADAEVEAEEAPAQPPARELADGEQGPR